VTLRVARAFSRTASGAAKRPGALSACLPPLFLLFGVACGGPVGSAQAATAAAGAYDAGAVETLLVTAERPAGGGPVTETHHRLRPIDYERFQPRSAADLLQRLPAAHLPTNSRGETLVYLRGAGERQSAVFFDGALLNAPWDNRYDLALLPAAVIGRAAAASGALSPQYGVNALGAVALSPPALPREGGEAVVDLSVGGAGERRGQAFVAARAGRLGLLAAGGAFRRDGDALPAGASLLFHQQAEDIRLNTDQTRQNALLRGEATFDNARLAATFLYTNGEKGVAPEGDRADARFWRYPQARTIMGVVSGDAAIGGGSELTGAVWAQAFSQTIDSYPNATYAVADARQEDDDLTIGARGIVNIGLGALDLSLSANILVSDHDQTDTDFSADDAGAAEFDALAAGDQARRTYRQLAASIGADAEYALTDRLTVDVGAGVDLVDYVETGAFPPASAIAKPVLRAGAAYRIGEGVRVRAALGRKSRMPTMRELFGAALNRFLVNPDLRPETVTTAELALETTAGAADLSLVVFGQDVDNTIDQRQTDGLRQRINLAGSTVAGVEVAGAAAFGERWRLAGNFTAARVRRKTGADLTGAEEAPDRFAERPGLLGRATLDYDAPGGFAAGVEALYTGRAFSFGPDGDLVALDGAARLNASASYALASGAGRDVELYLAARNLFDATLFNQAGLPAPGRSLIGGVRIRL